MKIIRRAIAYKLIAGSLLLPTISLGATETVESGNLEQQTLGGESSSDAAQAALEGIGAMDKYDFLRDGGVTLRTIWYSRSRTAVNTTPINEESAGNIRANVLGLGLDISSGYLWDLIGIDLALNSNIKVGSTVGQSEILYYDYVTNQESSEAVIGRASLKFKLGSETNGLKANIGYTPIDVGTIGTSSGLHSHAYRGLDVKYIYHDFEFGYGWADQFHNEWTKEFLDITNSSTQNQPPFQGTGQPIDYIQSVGGRYKFGPQKEGFVDIGVGQGKDFRTNQQIVTGYNFDLGLERSLNLMGYYFQGKYDTELSGIADPVNEWHTSFGANYKQGPWSFFAGYGKTYAPDSGEMNFALAPWANADNRNFIQTWGQLDDYVWDGEQVIKLGASYEVGKLINLPGLVAGVSYNYGWDLVNKNADGEVIGTSVLEEIDTQLTYKIDSGKFKGLGAGVYAAWLRGDTDFYGKPNRNDIKFIVSYEVALF